MSARLPDATKRARGTLRPGRTAAARAGKASGRQTRGQLWTIPLACPDQAAAPDWRELATAINSNRTSTEADRPLFSECVRALSIARRFAGQIELDGATITSPSGAIKSHPAVAGWLGASKLFCELAARFGCSPADRDRAVALGGESGPEALAEVFLFGNGGTR